MRCTRTPVLRAGPLAASVRSAPVSASVRDGNGYGRAKFGTL
jgi:hypothetical protein